MYETPAQLAIMLARWVPKDARQILDPCVGAGALIRPILRRRREPIRIIAIDRDARVLRCLGHELKCAQETRVSLRQADFLGRSSVDRRLFDCVIMNPPFASRKDEWTTTAVDGADRSIPTEVAFLLKAMKMTREGGRVLAILPGAIISGDLFEWLRLSVVRTAKVCVVHELPPFAFRDVEGRAFLLVLQTGTRSQTMVLRNHRLVKPDELRRRAADLGPRSRWDFAHHAARELSRKLVESMPDGQWSPLHSVAKVDRGTVDAPWGRKRVIHSTDRESGFWFLEGKCTKAACGHGRSVRGDDLLLVRVGRRCSQTAGLVVGIGSATMSSCLWRVRPMAGIDSRRLLFALRTVCGLEEIALGLERGTGSAYIAHQDIATVQVPMGLSYRYPALFGQYQTALERRSLPEMEQIEGATRANLHEVLGRASINR